MKENKPQNPPVNRIMTLAQIIEGLKATGDAFYFPIIKQASDMLTKELSK